MLNALRTLDKPVAFATTIHVLMLCGGAGIIAGCAAFGWFYGSAMFAGIAGLWTVTYKFNLGLRARIR